MNAPRLLERLTLPPSWRQRGERLQRSALGWWRQHPSHERRLMALAAVLVLAALLWLVVLRPAWSSLSEARERLPVLRSEMAQVQGIVREAQALRQGRSARVNAADVRAALNTSLNRAGLETSVAIIESAPGRWEAVVQDAQATQLMDWLASLPFLVQVNTESLALDRTNIDGRDRPGSVTGRIVFARDEEPAR